MAEASCATTPSSEEASRLNASSDAVGSGRAGVAAGGALREHMLLALTVLCVSR